MQDGISRMATAPIQIFPKVDQSVSFPFLADPVKDIPLVMTCKLGTTLACGHVTSKGRKEYKAGTPNVYAPTASRSNKARSEERT